MYKFKFYVIGLLFFVGVSNLTAQEDSKVRLAIGINPSVNWMSPSNEGYSSEGIRMGISYGVLTDFRLFGDDHYSLSSGFTFSHLGGKISSPDVYNNGLVTVSARKNSTYSLTNIDVPLVIRLKTNEIGYNVFYATFGSELGFNINATNKYTKSYNGTTTEETSDDISYGSRDKDSGEEYVNWFRTSLVFGFGVQRSISGRTSYRLGLTYHNGLTNMFGGKTYAIDANDNVIIGADGSTTRDRNLSTKLQFLELNLAIIF